MPNEIKKWFNAQIIKDISAVVDYLYEDEQKHYEECDEPTYDHIFLRLRRIKKWLEAKKK